MGGTPGIIGGIPVTMNQRICSVYQQLNTVSLHRQLNTQQKNACTIIPQPGLVLCTLSATFFLLHCRSEPAGAVDASSKKTYTWKVHKWRLKQSIHKTHAPKKKNWTFVPKNSTTLLSDVGRSWFCKSYLNLKPQRGPCLDIRQEASQVHQPQAASQAEPLEQRSLAGAGYQQPAALTVQLHHHHRPHQSRLDCLTFSFDSLKTER